MNMNLSRVMRVLLPLAVVLLATLAVHAQEMTFVHIPGIPGESNDAAHEGWIDAYALDHGSISPGGGGPTFYDVAFLKGTDKSSPKLPMRLAAGTNIGTVTVEVCRIGTPQECYYRLELTNSRITAVEVAGSSCVDPMTSCTPSQTESVMVAYTTITWIYTEWRDGSPIGVVEECWDLTTHTPC